MRTIFSLLSAAIILAILIFSFCCYVVSEREQAVVLQFGDPIAARTEPGLYFKIPMIQSVRYLPKTMQLWGGDEDHELPDLPTADGKKVEVTPWALWRITEPISFVRVLRETENAQKRVEQFSRNAMRDTISQYDLIELVRSSNRELTYTFGTDTMGDAGAKKEATDIALEEPEELSAKIKHGRPVILQRVKKEARNRLGNKQEDRGIEIVDIGVSSINFADSVRQVAFQRLIKFMESIAAYYTNDGERKKQEILNRTQAEVQRIQGEGKRQSNEIRGKVDAEIIKRFAEAIKETGEFYTFQRTLEAYKAAIGSDTKLILTTDSEFLRLLKELAPAPPSAATPEAAATAP